MGLFIPRVHDLQAQRFGRLVVVCVTKKRSRSGGIIWLCRCDCGNLKEVVSGNLHSGNTKSCGCLLKEKAKQQITNLHKLNIIHGDAKRGKMARLYGIWFNMKHRCLKPYATSYKYCGGKGIKVCDEWLNDYPAFKAWALANGYKDNLTIDRINPNGNYEPNNCQWISRSENTRKCNIERARRKK